jgi:ABC-2 type transport system ATP-binding protein
MAAPGSGERHVDAAISTRHLTKVYGGRTIAVNDMTLDIPQGVVFGLLGPNGAGKTTTLRLLLGLQRPTAGHAEVLGHRCGANAVAVRRLIGYLPTNPKLPGMLRPIEYLDLLGQMCGLPAAVRKPRLTSLLRAVGLLGVTNQFIQTLSTGETTRLGIAASLVADPPLLVWDEPTAGLDPAARRFTLDLIQELGKERTVLVATHVLNDIDQVCSHVGVMHEGRMIFCGPMAEMKARLRHQDITLDLEGIPGAIQALAAQLGQRQDAEVTVQGGRSLVIRVADAQRRAAILAEVLTAVAAAGVLLQAVHSGVNDTEHAYLQLLQEDEAHGFHRFQFDGDNASGAVSGRPAL